MEGRRRILFVSNSQGAASGLDGDLLWSNYPLLVQDRMPDLDCRYWMTSDLSVSTVDGQFREIVLQHRPHLAILQCGIIECALRILPRDFRDLLRIVPGGRFVTKALHDRQRGWRALLNRLGVRFHDLPLPAYRHHLESIRGKCVESGIGLVVLRIPPLSDQCERDLFPGNNRVIEEYNRATDEFARAKGVVCLDPFGNNTDATRNSLYLEDSVHFSVAGHRLIADNLVAHLSHDATEEAIR